MGMSKRLYQEIQEKRQDILDTIEDMIEAYGLDRVYKEVEELERKLNNE
jgi:TRAP-type C4-dicarboxylate transport system substrate-binding protein